MSSISRRRFLEMLACTGLSTSLIPPKTLAGTTTKQWIVTGQEVPELIAFDDLMRNFMQTRNISAASLAISKYGRLVLTHGYTYSDSYDPFIVQPTSLFRTASISKPITATAIMQLIQKGQLKFSDRFTDILSLPAANTQVTDTRIYDVTVSRLLQHLGGWNRYQSFDPMFIDRNIATAQGLDLPISYQDIIDFMMEQPLQHSPGEVYTYCNYGYCLLGRIIEAVSGISYKDYVDLNILQPLSIDRMTTAKTLPIHQLDDEVRYHSQYNGITVFDNEPLSVPAPYGAWNLENMDSMAGWLASAADILRFACTFDHPETSLLLEPEYVEAMYNIPEHVTPGSYPPGSTYYANGWFVKDWLDGSREISHLGSMHGTFGSLMRRIDGINWCVIFNQRDDPSGLSYYHIDSYLHSTADAISVWPEHNLFYSLFNIPTTLFSDQFEKL